MVLMYCTCSPLDSAYTEILFLHLRGRGRNSGAGREIDSGTSGEVLASTHDLTSCSARFVA